MPTLRMTDGEFNVLYMYIVNSDTNWSKVQWAMFNDLKKMLIDMKKTDVKKKLEADKVWDALKGVL